jgi:hypothetical protein
MKAMQLNNSTQGPVLIAALGRGQQWRSWVRFAHTGEAGGWRGETLALLTAGGAAVLSITGIALSYGRLRRWQRS